MADLKERLAIQIAGFANLVPMKGALVVGDGEQSTYLTLDGASDGDVLTVDSTAPEGLKWGPGGGTPLTFSSGVRKTLNNVTNDLVTGDAVSALSVHTNGNGLISVGEDGSGDFEIDNGESGALFLMTGAGLVRLAQGSQKLEFTSAGVINLTGSAQLNITAGIDYVLNVGQDEYHSAVRDIFVNVGRHQVTDVPAGNLSFTNGGGKTSFVSANNFEVTDSSGNNSAINLNATTGGFIASNDQGSRYVILADGSMQISGGGTAAQIDISTSANNDINVTTNGTGDFNLTIAHDELHTVGRNFGVTAAGATGSFIDASNGNLTLDAGSIGGTGEVRLMPTAGAPAATRTFRIWNGAGAGQQDGNINPVGGTVIDAEVRSTVAAILDYLHGWGWVTNPSP